MPERQSRLHDLARHILDAVVRAFVFTDDPPAVSYIADGAITFDFGSESAIVLAWDGTVPGVPGGTAAGGYITDGYFLSANFSVYVLRRAPMPDDVGNPPTFEEMADAAAVMFADATLAMNAVVDAFAAAQIDGICGRGAILRQIPIGPDGGVEGSRLYLAVQL